MDLADEIMAIKIEQGKHAERLDDLEEYQRRQNGSLQRVEGKVERMYQMVIGLLGGVVASLILLVVNLVVKP
ncbi:hypothetical protein [Desulfoscipio geothermicus]|uniref:hypothetical protein n=1 Tax=Desulfoscipio geothermicus TaxID=39060 RepID=UPI000B85037A|nr:hypothetical protein [Desulfoscipio geothermicus]